MANAALAQGVLARFGVTGSCVLGALLGLLLIFVGFLVSEEVFRTESRVTVRRHEACEECHGAGSAPGKGPTTCRSCSGRGQVRYQQGFFSIARTCPTCQGAGSVITDPCAKCKGEGRILRQRTVDTKVPAGVEDGTRIRF